MTTISYRDGVIAYDSRTTSGDLITNDNAVKMTVVEGVRFFWTGATADREKFLALYFGRSSEFKGVDASALIIDDGKLYLASVCKDDGFWKQPLPLDTHHASGSGQDFALTAMDMGATAKEAVQMAMLRDTKTGGRVRTFRIK